MSLEETLARTRAQSSSKIPLQVKQATILNAVESTLADDGVQLTPAAYFASLSSLLDQPGVAGSVVYLLSLVVPHVSPALLCSKLDVFVSKLAPLLVDPEADTSLIRSAISVLETVLSVQDLAAWQVPLSELGAMRTFSGLLALSEDARPRIRKRAADAVGAILSSPPPGPKLGHPAAGLAADTALQRVTSADAKDTAQLVHSLQLVKAVAQASWPAARLDELCELLLATARTNDQFVVMTAFDVFDAVLSSLDASEIDAERLDAILKALADLAPAPTDKQLAPAWFAAVAQAHACLAGREPASSLAVLPEAIARLATYLSAPAKEVVESAAQGLIALIVETLTPEMVLNGPQASSVLQNVADQLLALLHVKYQLAWAQVCQVYVAFLDAAQWRAPVDNAIKVMGALRSDDRLNQSRDATDSVLAAAIRSLGPEKVLELVPLQLSVNENGAGAGRAWLLPLLRENIQHARLAHYREYFMPLAAELASTAETMQNARNAKIILTVRDQILSLLPRYCDLPIDTEESFTHEFVEELMKLLYDNVEQRPTVCLGLKLLVESNLVYSEGAVEDPLLQARFSPAQAKASVDYLASKFAVDILKVLLNVFSKAPHDTRGYLLDTINVYLAIIDADAIAEMFNMVSTVLAENLGGSGDRELALTMMDVIIAIAPYLQGAAQDAFFNIFRTVAPLTQVGLLQKKAYRAFTRFVESQDGKIPHVEAVATFMIEMVPKIQPAARRTRLQALGQVVSALPDQDLYFIPAVLSEVMLATKDANERTREAAFDLLVLMGERMQQGGVIDHGKMPDIDDAEEVSASLWEFFTMIMAGLLGSTPHMISATVTALSYVFYHFRSELSLEQSEEIAETVWMFLTSGNREIVKSVLGFVKVSVLVLPVEVLEPKLPELLTSLVAWSNEHKNQFKVKVRHLIERLIRRFSFETLSKSFPEDHIKLLQNVHKSKERAKRKKTSGGAAGESAGGERGDRKFDDELEEVVYGSSSDSEDDEASSSIAKRNQAKNQAKSGGKFQGKSQGKPQGKPNGRNNGRGDQYIVNGDEPLDLLDQSALSHVSSSRPMAAPQKKLRHKLKERDGKLVIGDGSESSQGQSAIDAYVDAVRSGPVRTQRGKLKYRRGKRAQDELDEDDDDEPRKQGPRRFAKPKAQFPKRRKL